jgi:hypothetical protein
MRLFPDYSDTRRKTLTPPAMSEFDGIMRRARQQARASGMKPGDIAKAVAKARGKG